MKIAEKKAALAKLYKELEAGQKEMEAGPLSQERGDELQAKAQEAEALQTEVEQYERISGLAAKGREIPNPALPAGATRAEQEEETKSTTAGQVAGYISVGELFTSSAAYQAYVKSGCIAGTTSAPVAIEGLQGRFVPLSVEQRKAVSEALDKIERKAPPTIGAGVIEPQRIADVVRVTERDELRIRDLLNVSQTNSSSVEWVRITGYTRAAAMVAEGAAKPEATMSVDAVNTPVRTIAVGMPVTEQQLMDAPQITSLINGELLYDLDKVEEEEIMYGDGTGQHFDGILHNAGVLAGRTVTGDTILDKVRRAITDVRRSGYSPNGIAADPLDWEDMVLQKGTDDRYVWAVVTDAQGPRIWGLRVVETIGVEANAGNTTEERNTVVGDWIRGATLWDRRLAQVLVGWVNNQFMENMRTVRAEKREAFAVRKPKAFRKIQTVAAVP